MSLSFFFTVIIVLIVYFWFNQVSENKKNELSESFIDAKILLTKKKQDKALNILEKIIKKKDNTYSVLSLYLIIDNDLEKDNNKILNYFDDILSIRSLAKEDKNLISLKKTALMDYRIKRKSTEITRKAFNV